MNERDGLPSAVADGPRMAAEHHRRTLSAAQKRSASGLALARNSSQGPRRRVQSMEAANGNGQPTRIRRTSTALWSPPAPESDGDQQPMIFADEFDLYPRILHDVERAVKLKARRDARLRSGDLDPVTAGPSFTSRQALHAFPRQEGSSSTTDDVDFSPSTRPVPLHPVPISSDNGRTLDWSGFHSDEERHERRWTLSVSKRRRKDSVMTASALEKQEEQHAAHLTHIRTIASPNTMRKVAMTARQLGMRYSLLDSGSNFLKVARYLDPLERVELEKVEPFTWIKHLEKRGTKRARSPWYLSAMMIETYDKRTQWARVPDPQNPVDSQTSLSTSLNPLSPLTSDISLHPASRPRRSFEPLIEPPLRSSLDRQSRRSADSAYSSTFTGSSHPQAALTPSAPTGSPVAARDHAIAKESDDPSHRHRSISHVEPSPGSLSPAPRRFRDSTVIVTPPIATDGADISPVSDTAGKEPTIPRRTDRRFIRVSMPAERLSTIIEQNRQQGAEEAKLEEQYYLKSELLRETTAQNSRIRQLLNRVSNNVRELNTIQANMTRALEIPYENLPAELLEAFSHDPAAVTGATRRYRNYQAIDDIHNRLVRQREIFHNFLVKEKDAGLVTVPRNILGSPIQSLLLSLQSLDDIRKDITSKSKDVSEILTSVQAVHAKVKTEYNETLSHTSVVYPELSYIVALEESYKDQYQHFWEIGMDALTIFLDTVTPFWRTYGKTIGEDLQDFLIIPLYRNEYTGAAKRFPITRVPPRSFRHWIALLLLFYTSITVSLLQARAAITSTIHWRLLFVPVSLRWLLLPFFWLGILIQWGAVLTELAIVLTQFCVLFWWVGWSVKLFN